MVRYLCLALFPIVGLFLQSTFFRIYTINGALPDLVLVFVIFYALMNNAHKAWKYGFLCGVLEDLYLGRFIGMNALAKGITAYVIGILQGNVFKENLAVGLLSVFIGTILNTLCMLLISLVAYQAFHLNWGILPNLLYQAMYNLLLSAPLYVWYYNSSRYGVLRSTGER